MRKQLIDWWPEKLSVPIVAVLVILALAVGFVANESSVAWDQFADQPASWTLTVITLVYAGITYWIAKETKRGRQQEIRPVLDFHADEFMSKIANLGQEPARDVDLTLIFQPDGVSHRIQRQSLPAGAEIHIPAEPFKQIGDMEYADLQLLGRDINGTLDEDDWEDQEDPCVRLQLTGQITDAWGETISVDEEYDVWDLTSGEQGYVSYESDERFTREQIAAELRGINVSLADLHKKS